MTNLYNQCMIAVLNSYLKYFGAPLLNFIQIILKNNSIIFGTFVIS